MNWIERIFGVKQEANNDINSDKISSPQARTGEAYGPGHYNTIFTVGYDGEKHPGEIGDIKKYQPRYMALRARSWQAYLESDIAQSILRKYTSWVIGSGLRLQSQPVESILKREKVNIDRDEFVKNAEQGFRMFCESKNSSRNQQMNVHELAAEAFKNAKIGGDVLVVLRVKKGRIQIECVDGDHVLNPFLTGAKTVKNNGNRIENGIEMDKAGVHIAYHVRNRDNSFTRIKARSSNGVKMAFMIYGNRYKIDNTRGIPLMTSLLESITKLDRYKEAAVGAAEERAKIAYSIEHDSTSTGENPLQNMAVSSIRLNKSLKEETGDAYQQGEKMAPRIASTTGKQVFNMPKGSSLKALSSDMELSYDSFLMSNVQIICAAAEIPIEVALTKHENSFSASRAALKEWEHTLSVQRKDFSSAYYKPIYELWLIIEHQKQKINAPKLIESFASGDSEIFQAFTNCRWTGANVPHIDPLKEVKAERAKLGPNGAHLPLTTAEKATELLGEGDFDNNVDTFVQEEKKVERINGKEEDKEIKDN